MKNLLIVFLLLIVLGIVGFFAFNSYIYNEKQAENPEQENPQLELPLEDQEHIDSKSDLIVVNSPKPLDLVSSPLSISGEARGYWYFEASFTVRMVDSNGNVLGEHYATAQEEWMTEDFVSFEAELAFDNPQTETGILILEKANASGLEEHADELRIPVRFNADVVPQKAIQLYYYDAQKDTDSEGNIMCSENGLVAVERNIPVTQTPIQDTINLLLSGYLNTQEQVQGITTEYPLDGFELVGASISEGLLTLEFADPENQTSGGSCRAGILWMQIKETAEQFEEVDEAIFQPEYLFQP